MVRDSKLVMVLLPGLLVSLASACGTDSPTRPPAPPPEEPNDPLAGRLAYVSGPRQVNVINVETDAKRGFSTEHAVGVAVAPDGETVYVTHLAEKDYVSVIQPSTNPIFVIETIPVGDEPLSVAFTPDGTTAYVTNRFDDDVSVIDVASAAVTGTIPVGDQPRSVAFTPDGATAYVTDDHLSVIDVTTGTVTGSVGILRPSSVAVAPDGSTAYVTSAITDRVVIVDPATESVTGEIAVGDGPVAVAFTPDGEKAFVVNMGQCQGPGEVSVIDVAGSAVTGTLGVGECPQSVAVTPDGAEAWVVNRNSDDLSVIDVATASVTRTIQVIGNFPRRIAFTP